jgi:drug/metabolite transporter (DMT)-like permease
MLAALLALLAGASWGSSDFLGGLMSRRTSVWAVSAISQPSAVVTATVCVLLAGGPVPAFSDMLAPIVGGLVAMVAILAYYHALSIGTMSVVAPIVAASSAVPVIVGLVRGERPAVLQLVGMALTIAGIVAISRSRDDARRRVNPVSVLFALGASLGFGLMLVTLDLGGETDPIWTVFAARTASLALLGVYLAIRRPHLALSRGTVPFMAASGVLLAAANILFTLASGLGFLSVVAVLSSLSPVWVVVLARALLGERLTSYQLCAAATVLIGVVCLAVG